MAADAAAETPVDPAATEIRKSADATAEESAEAGEEAVSEEGQPKA
jgi:hypothetical protein